VWRQESVIQCIYFINHTPLGRAVPLVFRAREGELIKAAIVIARVRVLFVMERLEMMVRSDGMQSGKTPDNQSY